MKQPIFMLVYTSKSREPLNDEMILSILDKSRERNKEDNITGFLTARADYFLQLIEGPEDKVRQCYERICKDGRHSQITYQGEAFTDTRLTPNWSMGWVKTNASSDSTEELLHFFETGRAGNIFKDPNTLLTMMKMFSRKAILVDETPLIKISEKEETTEEA